MDHKTNYPHLTLELTQFDKTLKEIWMNKSSLLSINYCIFDANNILLFKSPYKTFKSNTTIANLG